MSTRNCHRILGVSANATGEEIKQAYKAMALRWHPDRHPDDIEHATRRFLEVQEAYQTLMRERYPWDSAISSPIHHRTESTSTYQSGSYFSASTSSLGSFIHVSASSLDSLVTPPSTVKSSGSSYKSFPSDSQRFGRTQPAVVSHPPRYAKDDHTRRPYLPPLSTLGRMRANHSSDNLRQHSSEWSNYTPPSLPKYSTTKPSRDSHTFTIVPPLRKPRSPVAPSSWDNYHLHQNQQTLALHSLGLGSEQEWIYGLALSLEELLNGKHCTFSLSRNLISGERKTVVLDVEIPPGCREGMRILCRGVGHERKNGTRQDIAFIVEELGHDHFSRANDDLYLDAKIPWDDSLRHQAADFEVEGLDGQKYRFRIDYPKDRVLKGKTVIRGAGMPIRSRGKVVGRGTLFIQWEIIPHHPRVLNFMKRFMHFRR
ncbi:hypothetical protein NP233_g5530 [Leucocoprinus birnbaumii]|uniref:J domain-containing protein n=1 Tax=Leucocoprinus birnbaumii TaxID=56174 RepID=A0AAD5VV11_9AGAR|nr:hypothetical protein NP233_g5530 [Leucocoprinus birnbaumii]